MRPLILAAMLISVVSHAHADSPKIFIFDVLNRPDYQASYDHMLANARGLPEWMATSEAAKNSTADPGIMIGDREVFEFCEPHNCGGHTFVVGFHEFGGDAIGVLSVDGQVRFFGHPSAKESKALLSQVPE